jgi:hypothetical protein
MFIAVDICCLERKALLFSSVGHGLLIFMWQYSVIFPKAVHVCHLLDELEIGIDKLFFGKITHNFLNIGKENISISNILGNVEKFQKFSE